MVYISITELIDVLLQSPRLKILTLRGCGIDDPVPLFEFLAYGIHNEPVCPLLLDIDIADICDTEHQKVVLLSTIISRWRYSKNVGAELTVRLRGSFRRSIGVERNTELGRCVSEGLIVRTKRKDMWMLSM